MHNSIDDSKWEVTPGGKLLQRRDDSPSSAVFAQSISITVSHGSSLHHLHDVSSHATFGDLKKALIHKTGFEAIELKILFNGVERDDAEKLQAAGVKDASNLVLVDDHKPMEQVETTPVITEEMTKAIAAVFEVTWEVDTLSDRVGALEVAVNAGTEVAMEEFDMAAELLMRQLLKLDGIEAEGEARLQRKGEVRRVQKLQELVDTLKAKCSNPFVDQSKAAAVSIASSSSCFATHHFGGVESDDAQQLQAEGVKDTSMVFPVEDPNPNKRVEQVEQPPVITEEMSKAMASVIEVTWEVDMLSERIGALEVAVNGGTKVAMEEFDMTAELLMRQLLKLDGIEADGEVRLQRKGEVRRIQKLQEIVDTLKARCPNPLVDQSKL